MTGVKKKVKNVTAKDAVKLVTKNSKNKKDASYKVCVLTDVLKICKKYDSVPVVEIKDSEMSDEAVRKMIDDLYVNKQLDIAWVISFHDTPLMNAVKVAEERYGIRLNTLKLITKNSKKSILSQVKKAKKKGYTGVDISHTYATKKSLDWAQDHNMKLGLWTYSKKKWSDMYGMIVENQPDFMTVNGKLFDD